MLELDKTNKTNKLRHINNPNDLNGKGRYRVTQIDLQIVKFKKKTAGFNFLPEFI